MIPSTASTAAVAAAAMITPEQLVALQQLAAAQVDKSVGDNSSSNAGGAESDEEEPSPEALMRYMAMRRHTIGVGDSLHDAPQDVRAKLAQHKPILGMCMDDINTLHMIAVILRVYH